MMKSKILFMVLICLASTPIALSQGTCGRPLVDEAVYRPFQNEFAVGESVTYSCRTGHQLQSGYTSLNRTCQADLTWSSVGFVCERQSCGFPDTPSNGHIVGDTYTFGSTIEYFCNKGFELSTGASSVRSNCVPVVGSDPPTVAWSVATAPTCSRVPCPNPTNIANGRFEDSGVAYEYGARIEYFCDNGFKSNEASPIHRTCDENGTWGDPPQCLVDYDCDFEDFHQPTCGYSNTGWSREFRRDGLSGRSYVLHRSSGDATLTSPALTIEPPGACLSFYYRGTLRGTRLEVSQTTPGTNDASLSGGKSESDWQEAKIDLTPSNNVEFNVKVSGDPADVEIDDLTLNLSPCSVPTTAAPPGVQTTPVDEGPKSDTEDTVTVAPPASPPLSVPAIVGIAVGAVAVVLILSFVVYFCHAKKQREKKGIPGVPMSSL
ncbi:unnamed protein product [Clavelina lepadiformis]|uniref:Uncharacterized protein n=1 Tax=Clavelina lepadiformis TaxID=159417 RepID=A0ABP0GJ20_CLALP